MLVKPDNVCKSSTFDESNELGSMNEVIDEVIVMISCCPMLVMRELGHELQVTVVLMWPRSSSRNQSYMTHLVGRRKRCDEAARHHSSSPTREPRLQRQAPTGMIT